MRISDWSSDVCSSDLLNPVTPDGKTRYPRLSEKETWRKLMAVAKHETAHLSVAWHSEVYAQILTGIDKIFDQRQARSEEHTSELQSIMRISYAVFCLKKKKQIKYHNYYTQLIKHTLPPSITRQQPTHKSTPLE